MQEFIKWPKIGQFRNAVKAMRSFCDYHQIPLPVVMYTGTIKVHGTNAAVRFINGEVKFQSRNRMISVDDDNLGFARWADEGREAQRHSGQEDYPRRPRAHAEA